MIDASTISAVPIIFQTSSRLAAADRWDHLLARLDVKRDERRVAPGLYALGFPSPDSPVFVTANYRLSFDALRSALSDLDSYILVLDTQGVNVWCAAGKGTFGTEEIALRVIATRLKDVVRHRRLVLPQLGAPGVAAHKVKEQTGFRVEYGPVRAADLPGYMQAGKATEEMRRVRFSLADRLVVIPVELVHALLPTLAVAVGLYFLAGWVASLAAVAAVLAGTVLFPILLPWLPTRNFSSRGFLLGALVALPFSLSVFLQHPDWPLAGRVAQGLQYLLIMPAVTAFLALNFTGSTTFTSRTGVRREIFAYIPAMAWTFGLGVAVAILSIFIR
ncbi:MAG: mercury methylation corrinoid protein HgcA [Chloroflexota bacterium]